MKRSYRSLQAALIYLLIGGLWIYLSDWLVALMFTDPEQLSAVQTQKGWAYVAVTAVLGYFLVRRIDQTRKASLSLLQRHQLVFNQQYQFMAILSPRGIVEDINELPLQVMKVPREDFVGRYFWCSTAWKDLPEWQQIWQQWMAQAAAQEQPVRGEVPYHTAAGELRYADSSILAIRAETGEVDWFLVQGTDITEQKQALEELELTAKVFEQGREGVIICDADNRILTVNRGLCEITGYTREQLIGETPKLLKSGHHDDVFYRQMWQALHEEGSWQGEVWDRRRNGEVFPAWQSISAVRDGEKVTHYISVLSDISQHKQAEAHIHYMSHHDALTQLPNRTLLNDRITQAIARAKREALTMAVLHIDLDRFKNINDSLGHRIGDQLLKLLAGRLKETVRDEDTVARLGGDEFVLLFPEISRNNINRVAEKFITLISDPFFIEGHELIITPSIGLSVYPGDGETADEMLQKADAAMHHAKLSGRNLFSLFQPQMQESASRALQLENALRWAIERGELSVQYQPQVDLKDGRIIGCEALVRWRHPKLGMISPVEFIPLAEESGQMISIGDWVLQTAVAQNSRWQRQGLGKLVMAVNLSAAQFNHINLKDRVGQVLKDCELDAGYLELELTESMTMQDTNQAVKIMNGLRRQGVQLSLDDFGTGYSSLSQLKRFNIQRLKIDQSFVRDVGQDEDDEAIVTAIIGLARSLHLKTIAEGVETQQQLEFLRERGCDEIQGYLISKPLPAAEFEALLRQQAEVDALRRCSP